MTDDQIKARCAAVGIKWLEADDDPDGFPGSFDMVTMPEMRALLCGDGCAEKELGGAACSRHCEVTPGVAPSEAPSTKGGA